VIEVTRSVEAARIGGAVCQGHHEIVDTSDLRVRHLPRRIGEMCVPQSGFDALTPDANWANS
jgi:hypothetical protein